MQLHDLVHKLRDLRVLTLDLLLYLWIYMRQGTFKKPPFPQNQRSPTRSCSPAFGARFISEVQPDDLSGLSTSGVTSRWPSGATTIIKSSSVSLPRPCRSCFELGDLGEGEVGEERRCKPNNPLRTYKKTNHTS